MKESDPLNLVCRVCYEIYKSVTECFVGVAEASCICWMTPPASCVEHFKWVGPAGVTVRPYDFKA